jgi:uncharacterized tellurite resistance protein B-like protein
MLNLTQIELDLETTICIANGMKEMANADNEFHADEAAMIEGFLHELRQEHGEFTPENSDVRVELINTLEKQQLFLQCLTYVALADRRVAPEERALLEKYITSFSLDITPQDLIGEIGSVFLSRYKGISIFRDEAVSIGKDFGISEERINDILDS